MVYVHDMRPTYLSVEDWGKLTCATDRLSLIEAINSVMGEVVIAELSQRFNTLRALRDYSDKQVITEAVDWILAEYNMKYMSVTPNYALDHNYW